MPLFYLILLYLVQIVIACAAPFLLRPCIIYDKTLGLLKRNFLNHILIYFIFSGPFWIGLFYFLSRITRAVKTADEQGFFITAASAFLSFGLLLLLFGKIILTASFAINITGQKSNIKEIISLVRGKIIKSVSVCGLFTALCMLTLYCIIPPALFYLASGICLPIILLEEEEAQKPIRAALSTIFRNFAFLVKLSFTGFIILLLFFINVFSGILFTARILGFFHIFDYHSIHLRLLSPLFISFCAIIAFSFFDFLWTLAHSVYFFHHSADCSGKDLSVRLKNLSAYEKHI